MKLFRSMVFTACLILLCFSTVNAGDQSQQIYESKVDNIISFYEGRLYLLNSEHTILSDIAKDAKKMLRYLYGKKSELIKEMMDKNMVVKPEKIHTYIVNKARMSEVGLGYTKQ